MRTGRPKAPVVLTPAERHDLNSLARRWRAAPAVARRARLVLACAAGHDNLSVARRVRVSPTTVGKWRARFLAERVAGLFDEPRAGTPRQISDHTIEEVVVRTLETRRAAPRTGAPARWRRPRA